MIKLRRRRVCSRATPGLFIIIPGNGGAVAGELGGEVNSSKICVVMKAHTFGFLPVVVESLRGSRTTSRTHLATVPLFALIYLVNRMGRSDS